ncbi:MAG: YaaA family protein [Candidatus Izemoplasmataceae bacterium]
MHIIISPSKTMRMTTNEYLTSLKPIDLDKTNQIITHLQQYSKKALQQVMLLSDKLIDEVYPIIQQFKDAKEGHAILSYRGFVFQKLAFSTYTKSEYLYIEEHVRILDALYGFLNPSTLIKPYRLDFQMKLGLNLYQYWTIDEYLDEPIINLASNEYHKLIKYKKTINISFLQCKKGQLRNIPTHTKQARGMMLNYMILNKIENIEDIRNFSEAGYTYEKDLSSAQELVFIR